MIKNLSRSTAGLMAALALIATVAPAGAAINLGDPPEGGGGGGTPPPPPPPPPGYWEKVFNSSAMYGTTDWGAGYQVATKLAATPANSSNGYKDTLEGNLYLAGRAKLNGSSHQLFAVRAAGVTKAKSRSDFSLTAYAGSAAIYTKSYASATSTYTFLNENPSWPMTFIDKSTTVYAGPVPITLGLKATGELKAPLTGKISNVGLEAAANPSGKASLYANAGIGFQYCALGYCVGASGGVYVDLTLIEAALPATAKLWWSLTKSGSGVNLNHLLKADLTLKSLDGELGVYAEAHALVFDEYWNHALLDWPGFVATLPIANVAGTYCLVGTCTTPIAVGSLGL